jgi:aminopeptidase N
MTIKNRRLKGSNKGWFSAKSRPFIGMVLMALMSGFFSGAQALAQGDGQRYFERSDASQPSYTRADSLRGGVTAERAWWDVTHYHLQVAVDIEGRALSGLNRMHYRVRESLDEQTARLMQRSGVEAADMVAARNAGRLQIDLQAPMQLVSARQEGRLLEVEQEGSAWFISGAASGPGVHSVDLEFEGQPVVAANPPWDGGITWQNDRAGSPFVASANQGIGASVWWPNKDHPWDEPDSMLISVRLPDSLMNVSNGRLRGVEAHSDDTHTTHWAVVNPINNYGVNINIAAYEHFSEVYNGLEGPLAVDYYVLPENLEAARRQFAEVPRTLEAFEYWFGPYPFYEDGFKIVEVPYLGMEHQSSVTYGNGFKNGYRGRDLSGSGWGMEFDFIIVHEAAHEWFANSLTNEDVADMWIHESFTNYAESLFLEYHFGWQAAQEYVRGLRFAVSHDRPVIPDYGVNERGSGDMYYRGSNFLHTLRSVVANDSLWRDMLLGLNREFYHQTVGTEALVGYMSEVLGLNVAPLARQYLMDTRLPVLEYGFRDGQLRYRYAQVRSDFAMPVDVKVEISGPSEHELLVDLETRLEPTNRWQELDITELIPLKEFARFGLLVNDESDFLTDLYWKLKMETNYYVGSLEVNPGEKGVE